MSDPDLSARAAQVLSRAAAGTEQPENEAARRATIDAMERALAAPPPARWPRYALAAGFLFAAVTAGLFFARQPGVSHETTVAATASSLGTVRAPGRAPEPLVAGALLPETSRVTTPSGSAAVLEFSTGSRVELAAASDLTLEGVAAHQRLYLAGGKLFARVAKVAAGSRFEVTTRDAEIEVHGTAFTVEVVPVERGCSIATSTRVHVEEGVVAVRFGGNETRVKAGEHWPDGCDPAPPAEGSSLAAQNDLFAHASALERQGDARGAIALYEHLLEVWPTGPLAESAAVERMKLLATVDRAAASTAARDYLRQWPSGFAKLDAQELARPR